MVGTEAIKAERQRLMMLSAELTATAMELRRESEKLRALSLRLRSEAHVIRSMKRNSRAGVPRIWRAADPDLNPR